MREGHRDLFRSVAEEIGNRNSRQKVQTKECMRVLDEEIRPVFREASEEIVFHGEMIEFHSECIRVHGNELRFKCRGDSVEIYTRINDYHHLDTIKIQEVSKDLVADKIARFFRQAYNL